MFLWFGMKLLLHIRWYFFDWNIINEIIRFIMLFVIFLLTSVIEVPWPAFFVHSKLSLTLITTNYRERYYDLPDRWFLHHLFDLLSTLLHICLHLCRSAFPHLVSDFLPNCQCRALHFCSIVCPFRVFGVLSILLHNDSQMQICMSLIRVSFHSILHLNTHHHLSISHV